MANVYDIVYILKPDAAPDELRYSLRSVEANFQFRKIWFYCGKPDGLEPDEYVAHIQTGAAKWERVRSSLVEICKNNDITKKFWLFNDDFYVLKPTKSTKAFYNGVIRDHYLQIEERHGGRPSSYSIRLKECEAYLDAAGLTRLNYALHVPMLVDRAKLLEVLEMFPRCPMVRNLYGNYAKVGGEYHQDVKIADPLADVDAGADYLSTSDQSFKGKAGAFLAERFPDKSRFEV